MAYGSSADNLSWSRESRNVIANKLINTGIHETEWDMFQVLKLFQILTIATKSSPVKGQELSGLV